MKNNKSNRYIIELIIVVVFLCILAAVVIPRIKDMFG